MMWVSWIFRWTSHQKDKSKQQRRSNKIMSHDHHGQLLHSSSSLSSSLLACVCAVGTALCTCVAVVSLGQVVAAGAWGVVVKGID